MRAADAVEKITARRPELLRPHKRRLLTELALIPQQEVRWHVAQMLPRLSLSAPSGGRWPTSSSRTSTTEAASCGPARCRRWPRSRWTTRSSGRESSPCFAAHTRRDAGDAGPWAEAARRARRRASRRARRGALIARSRPRPPGHLDASTARHRHRGPCARAPWSCQPESQVAADVKSGVGSAADAGSIGGSRPAKRAASALRGRRHQLEAEASYMPAIASTPSRTKPDDR